MNKDKLIFISTSGEISVLGVRIGMSADVANTLYLNKKLTRICKDPFATAHYFFENGFLKKVLISGSDSLMDYMIASCKHLSIIEDSRGKGKKTLVFFSSKCKIFVEKGYEQKVNVYIEELGFGEFMSENSKRKGIKAIDLIDRPVEDNPLKAFFVIAIIVSSIVLISFSGDIFDYIGYKTYHYNQWAVIAIAVVFVLFVASVVFFIYDYKKRNLYRWIDDIVKKNKERILTKEISLKDDVKRKADLILTEIENWRNMNELAFKQRENTLVKKEKELVAEKSRYEKEFKILKTQLNNEHSNRTKQLLLQKALYEKMVKDSLFKRSASLYADYKVLEIDAVETYLRTKKSPIREGSKTDEELKRLKQDKREDVARYKEMLYKWEFLMNLFPELSKYVDDENDIQDLECYEVIDDVKENYDRSRDYLTDEEYRILSEDERNQRALDVWKKRRRPSKWIAGVEYEMYCAYILRSNEFYVVEHGIQKGLNDLGIDLIAKKENATYVIQCKRYSNAMVHENTICQLFGTTLKYKLDNQNLFGSNITPLLLTTGKLTDTAKEFAEKLGVKVMQLPMGDYPMIKCNINNGNKIYHLPFDQQYWRTIIESDKGEFYAATVKEATQEGFRRAFKYRLLENEK